MSIAIRAASDSSTTYTEAGARAHIASDSWLDSVAKLIPGEAILVFNAALLLPGVEDAASVHLALLIVLTAVVPTVLWVSATRAGIRAPWLQYIVRTLAFVLHGLGSDRVLARLPGRPGWLLHTGALVVTLLAALVLTPPGAHGPPPTAVRRK